MSELIFIVCVDDFSGLFLWSIGPFQYIKNVLACLTYHYPRRTRAHFKRTDDIIVIPAKGFEQVIPVLAGDSAVHSRRQVVVVEAVVVGQMQMRDSRRQLIDILPESIVLVEIGITCVEAIAKRLKPPCDFLYRWERSGFEAKSDIVQFGEVRHNFWTGIHIQDVNRWIAESLGLRSDRGAIITNVEPNSPGAKAGLQRGDVIISVNGKAITSDRDVRDEFHGAVVGQRVELRIIRNGREITVTLVLEEIPRSRRDRG